MSSSNKQERVVIGITTYGRNAEGRFTLPAEYVDSVRRSGALAITLSPGEVQPEDWLELLDGIVLAGGGDLDPELWQSSADEHNDSIDPERDATEIALARHVLEARLPSLWICRGLQLLNFVRGGSLIQHLPAAVGETVQHRQPPKAPILHGVRVEHGTRLARTLAATEIESVSFHHQAIDRLGAGLVAVAHAPDGVIEAVELEDRPELEAVQWHPELSSASDCVQQRLFDALASRARASRATASR